MINSRLQCGAIAAVEPPMTFPFLWRGRASGDTYLRVRTTAPSKHYAADPPDVRLFTTAYTNNSTLGPTFDGARVPDDEAWGMRLKPSEAVVLANEA